MLCVTGTIPADDFPLIEGKVEIEGNALRVGSSVIQANRGTPALIAAAAKTAETLGKPLPFACLVGDTGRGDGSRLLYERMAGVLPENRFQTLVFHYLQPIVQWHDKLQGIIAALKPKPVTLADAGFMYVAKMAGKASRYDLFTPDVGELAYLADEQAPHPFYTRGFILHEDNRVPDLVARAYKNRNAPRYLLVKGATDYLADETGILETVDSPSEEAMEAIGGTGDTLTGIVSVLIDAGMPIPEAAAAAMRINRIAGRYAQPTPATQIIEIIEHIPQALREALPGGMN